MTCIKCGGDMIGDGYTSVMHCEYADDTKYEFHEPDADPVYCDYSDEGKKMKIQNIELNLEDHYLDRVTYVPGHANGNAGHPDCEKGVITRFNDSAVFVLYCTSRTVQNTDPEDLVWG